MSEKLDRLSLTEKQSSRLLYFIDIKSSDECWEWKGGVNKDGYGNFEANGFATGAHRFAYRHFVGPVPHGMSVLHHCDNRPCCNPKHLWLGTQLDNVLDMERKGRADHPSGERSGKHTKPESTLRGSAIGTSRLKEPDVLQIRKRFACGEANQPQLAAKFGVTQTCISMIVLRKAWKHVP